MKNYLTTAILSLSLIAILPLKGTSQVRIGPAFGIGISSQKLGISNYYGIGYKVGMAGSMPLYKKLDFVPEFNYSSKGFVYMQVNDSWFGPVSEKKATLSLSYLNLDLPVRIYLNQVTYIKVGIQAGYLVQGNYKMYNEGTTIYKSDITENVKRFDFGGLGGLGFQFKNGFGMSLMINAGFIEINSDKAVVLNPYEYSFSNEGSNQGIKFGKNFLGTFGLYYLIKT